MWNRNIISYWWYKLIFQKGGSETDVGDQSSDSIVEPSRVKEEEAALDDKLGVELRSIVDQIQVNTNDRNVLIHWKHLDI